ncbi:hypothetical protein [Altererythrobacter sp. GH1-8]|uniref:hypothetical protein n=1 Tax=Altererythrobacter sp. GH1-8 TaxID=3349333 RepID=UPI00374DBE07
MSGALVVAACSGAQEEGPVTDESVAADTQSVAADPSMWASAEDAAGTYSLTYADGTEGVLTVAADGTAEGVIGGEEFTASFTVPEPGKLCYTDLSNEDLSVPAQCWVNSPMNEDGSWNFAGDDGTAGTAKPAE